MKLGYQAPRKYKTNKFNSIEVEGDLHYCASHNLMYNPEKEEKTL